jgi:hypothetical protein
MVMCCYSTRTHPVAGMLNNRSSYPSLTRDIDIILVRHTYLVKATSRHGRFPRDCEGGSTSQTEQQQIVAESQAAAAADADASIYLRQQWRGTVRD